MWIMEEPRDPSELGRTLVPFGITGGEFDWYDPRNRAKKAAIARFAREQGKFTRRTMLLVTPLPELQCWEVEETA